METLMGSMCQVCNVGSMRGDTRGEHVQCLCREHVPGLCGDNRGEHAPGLYDKLTVRSWSVTTDNQGCRIHMPMDGWLSSSVERASERARKSERASD